MFSFLNHNGAASILYSLSLGLIGWFMILKIGPFIRINKINIYILYLYLLKYLWQKRQRKFTPVYILTGCEVASKGIYKWIVLDLIGVYIVHLDHSPTFKILFLP